MNLCEVFKQLAIHNWQIIEHSRRVNYQLKEETLTDINLLHLKSWHPEIQTVAFTKWDEGSNGADWEWWFSDGPKRWLGFRVQAKILNISKGNFEHLYYQKDLSSVSQCEKLIVKALADKKTPCVPIYALYLHHATYPDQTHIKANLNKEFYGCSLISAYKVRSGKVLGKARGLNAWQSDLIPWHLLVCPSKGSNLLDHIYDFARSNFNISLQQNIETYIISEPPSYIIQSQTNQAINFVAEENPHNLAGAVVFDANNF